jgi:RNA-directed DNA polymerase
VNLSNDKRQKTDEADSWTRPSGEAGKGRTRETESLLAMHEHQSPANTERMMEEICEWENLKQAMWGVKANKGSAGIDGMTVKQLPDYRDLVILREQLLNGTYEPQPVKRVEIPKPDGGKRQLGIPTVRDRFVQLAVMQVLEKYWDRTFSDSSYGFRPGRSTHQAVARAQHYMASGYSWVVDLDLEKFLDHASYCTPVHEVC